MPTVHYRNAVILLDGYDLSADFREFAVEVAAEVLDGTAFGDDTRKRKGGLKTMRGTGAGFYQGGPTAVGGVLYGNVGTDDLILTAFPDGVTDGTAQQGVTFKGVEAQFQVGAAVGVLLPFSFAFEGREGTS